MHRHWLLSSTFYGNWLPGDPRGFVARVRDQRPHDPPREARFRHNLPGTDYDADMPGLHQHSLATMTGPRVHLNLPQAKALLAQFQETALHRSWRLFAVAIMPNHVHIVTGVLGDPSPTKILGDFKAWGSRALTRHWDVPLSGTWWTYGGSKRKLKNQQALLAAIEYVRNQAGALIIWIPE